MLTHRAPGPEDTATRPRIFEDKSAATRRSQTQKETSSVASTLLAVDDSVTMRKVLEITFASPDFRVVTANSPDAALQKLKSDKPDLVITDLSLEPTNGYDLCKAIKKASPSTPVIVLSSKQNAFDPAKGTAAQADDHMDKPFDTQQMIDKVKKLLAAQPAAGKAPVIAPKEVVTAQTTPSMQSPFAPAARPVAAGVLNPPPAAAAAAAAAGSAPQRAKTLIYNPPATVATGTPAPPRAPAGPTPVSGLPTQPKAPEAQPAPIATVVPATAAQVNGQMVARLEQLGLTPAQIDGVLALSRDVVERVVWEVVPVLAETIIKEEIARLTK
jgi:CheY-like chemotaxis protein